MSPKIYKAFDDSHTPDAAYFKELKRVAKKMIIWGGNYFLDNLGATECFIVWDKKRRGLNFADCELAWTNIKQPCRIFEWKWNGMLQEDMKNKEYRIHPTQKPVALYRWLIEKYMPEGGCYLTPTSAPHHHSSLAVSSVSSMSGSRLTKTIIAWRRNGSMRLKRKVIYSIFCRREKR